MKKGNETIYHAALYLRLSNQKLNEEIGESDSIVNQEALLRSHLTSHPEIEIKKVFKDDGWSGVNFNRPAFQKMMQMVYDNEIDCIVVKDLSRLGRNHTETGKYITRVFPAFGVRFIAVNDHIDTATSNSDADNFIIPFKDLLNDSYSRDLSIKIRSARAVKNADGDFGGGFYCYGYEVDPKDKNHYIIDEEAADVVKKIFSWTIDGIGSTQLCRRLNALHILSPREYKRKKKEGDDYVQGKNEWNIYQIYRMLRNDVYVGTLRLGKTTTPNYKLKKIIVKPEEEQYVFEDHHEAIIPRSEFELVQEILNRDCRVALHKRGSVYEQVYPLTGYIYCADCGGSMVVKTSTMKGKSYKYYICSENKKDSKFCSTHTVKFDRVNKAVLRAINTQLKILTEAEELFRDKELDLLAQPEIEKLQIQIGRILEKKYQIQEQIKHLQRDLDEGIINKSEYIDLKADFQKEIKGLEKDAAQMELKKKNQIASEEHNMFWIRKYRENGELTELTRREVVIFLDRVEVKDPYNIKVKFRFGNEYKKVLKHYKRVKKAEGNMDDETVDVIDEMVVSTGSED